jgi:late competence protein required for DNA uptake (superfamily II DNA/RNA helicase)
MILNREISIKISESNFHYFENLGYEITIGDELLIPIELLSKGSHQKIQCQCDGCGIVKQVIFKNYIKYGNEFGMYYCRKCSEYKRKETLQKNYGVEYPIQNKKLFKKMKLTISEKKKSQNDNES